MLVDQRGRDYAFRLIDTDHCRFFPGCVDQRRRIKNLAQLSASIPASITATDRARWYSLYRGVLPDEGDGALGQEAFCREVDALVAQKIVVVDEPIE